MLLKFKNVINDVINFSKVSKEVTEAKNFIKKFYCVATVICY
jgi:hypothetical protein